MKLCPSFNQIWIVLFAVVERRGEALQPMALAAAEISGRHKLAVDCSVLRSAKSPPYPTDDFCLVVTTNAEKLAGCHLALGWPMPMRIVDLLIEWRCMRNGHSDAAVGGIAGALLGYGLPLGGMTSNCPSSEQLKLRVGAIERLFMAMQCSLDVGRALLRGRYLCAVARIERTGIPIDRTTLDKLSNDWPGVRSQIIDDVNKEFGVWRGEKFDQRAFADLVRAYSLTWPTNLAGRLDLSEAAFRDMARTHPAVRPLKELQTTLDRFDPRKLAVGCDGRNRTPVRPFTSRTGRNQPSASASVFGSAAWVRHLVKPEPGTGVALLDWQQQEFGIAAALSGDGAMQAAYRSGDPYLALAVAAGAAPAVATAQSHADARDRFKACALGVQYGMGPARMALQLGLPEADATELLARHRAAFPKFWRWSDGIEAHAMLQGKLQSVFGWRFSVGPNANPRGLRNFPMQANGAEMLRLACCLATEAGLQVCATIHDALLIEAPLAKLDDAIRQTQKFMAEASSIVLDGFPLRTDVKRVHAPDRWSDIRASSVWFVIERIVADGEPPARQRDGTCVSATTRSISYMS